MLWFVCCYCCCCWCSRYVLLLLQLLWLLLLQFFSYCYCSFCWFSCCSCCWLVESINNFISNNIWKLGVPSFTFILLCSHRPLELYNAASYVVARERVTVDPRSILCTSWGLRCTYIRQQVRGKKDAQRMHGDAY